MTMMKVKMDGYMFDIMVVVVVMMMMMMMMMT